MESLQEILTPKDNFDLAIRLAANVTLIIGGLYFLLRPEFSTLGKKWQEWRIKGRAENLFYQYFNIIVGHPNLCITGYADITPAQRSLMVRVESDLVPDNLTGPVAVQQAQLLSERKRLMGRWKSLAVTGRKLNLYSDLKLHASLRAVAKRELYG